MPKPVKTVLALYGGWSLLWLAVAYLGNTFSGHGELGISAHVILAFTGLPFGLLSFHIVPNGTVFCVAVAGAIGTAQWCAVAELNRRWERWQSARKNAS
ncbi:MAG: hypothetical protein ACREUW_11860 [Burkholderiales bacterium]